jgi:hypothetical protein
LFGRNKQRPLFKNGKEKADTHRVMGFNSQKKKEKLKTQTIRIKTLNDVYATPAHNDLLPIMV